jgi:hypothetical protein
MSLPFSFIGSWSYTNPATPVAVNIPMTAKPDWVFVKDTTNWGAQSTAANPIYAEWFSANMASGAYLALGQPSSTGTGVTTYTSQGTTGGFTFINQTNPPTFTKVAVTTVNGTSFVVATSNTAGLNVGDLVRLINITGAQQISGPNLYQITAITANTNITLGYAASAASAGLTVANGTTGFYQKVYPSQFLPNTLPVAYITQANPATVYFFRQNPYVPGELVDFQIPTPYGMTQLSNLTGKSGSGPFTSNPSGAARVLTVTNSATVSSITIDIDTTGFTAFQYPTSAAFAGGASPAVCIPAGSGVVPLNGSATIPASPPGTALADAFDNKSQYIMNIGTNAVGVANANMVVMAFKADFVNGITNA